MMIKSFPEMKAALHGRQQKIKLVVAAAQDTYAISAAYAAIQEGIAEVVLVGNAEAIRQCAAGLQIPTGAFTIIDAPGDLPAQCELAVAVLLEQGGQAIMKGLVDSAIFLRAILNRKDQICAGKLLSHVAVTAIPQYHKLVLISDGGMIITPSLAQKAAIIENALVVARALEISLPKVGVICAREKVDPKMAATVDAAELEKMNQQGLIKNCLVKGPISFDIAFSREAARHKGVDDPVAGEIDIAVMPSGEAGNILYKALALFAGAQNAGVVVGAKFPIIMTSRSDSAATKLNSIALAALLVSPLMKDDSPGSV